jgi:predicted RNA-binding Zn-ribbon protein involved in translation (DUF1610 family)
MRILVLDIETSPNIAHVWRCYKENVSPDQLLRSHDILCWAAKWYGDNAVYFGSGYHTTYRHMLDSIHALLDEADVVVHFNGKKFDIPHLNRAFICEGLLPPSTYKQVDLLEVVKNNFRFPMNKLQHVALALGLGCKEEHEGHKLWVKCMNGDAAAWARMHKYNIQDVRLTESLYDKLLPWVSNHPNHNLFVDADTRLCPNCGSADVHKRGFHYTIVSRFQRYKCNNCGAWSRGRSNLVERGEANVGIRG